MFTVVMRGCGNKKLIDPSIDVFIRANTFLEKNGRVELQRSVKCKGVGVHDARVETFVVRIIIESGMFVAIEDVYKIVHIPPLCLWSDKRYQQW